MKKLVLFVSIAVLTICAFTSFTLANQNKNHDKEHGGQPLTATLSGAAEVPGPGDTDGTGTANVTLNHGQGQVCYDITVSNIEKPTAAHIHVGAAGAEGGVKVPLKAAADGSWKGCTTVDKAVVKEIMDNPSNYYVNVHTADFPKGAIRGQLSKK